MRDSRPLEIPGTNRIPAIAVRLGRSLLAGCAGLLGGAVLGLAACSGSKPQMPSGAQPVHVVATWPHDPGAYTQGLVVHGGYLYEGTGGLGSSRLQRVDLETGSITLSHRLEDRYFGEGITIFEDRLYQLTLRSNVIFVYDPRTLKPLHTLTYPGEAWGLTHDETHLILSDGSANLVFLDPRTASVVRVLPVQDQGRPVDRLNELEYVQGEVWANVWYDDRIVRIAPESGAVTGWLDLGHLYTSPQRDRHHVLNGIAYDASSSRLFVTGKHWPTLFELRVP